jgi:hypothetical protein
MLNVITFNLCCLAKHVPKQNMNTIDMNNLYDIFQCKRLQNDYYTAIIYLLDKTFFLQINKGIQ